MTNTEKPEVEAGEVDLYDLSIRLLEGGARMIECASHLQAHDQRAARRKEFVYSTGRWLQSASVYVTEQIRAEWLSPEEIARIVEIPVIMADSFLEHGPIDLLATREVLTRE